MGFNERLLSQTEKTTFDRYSAEFASASKGVISNHELGAKQPYWFFYTTDKVINIHLF
ncbi:MAG: hypothetical protein WCJ11_08520 [Methylococcaceae bacterium]